MISCLRCQKRMPRQRGLCQACYQWYYQAVKAGKMTWKELEDSGAIKVAIPRSQRKWRF